MHVLEIPKIENMEILNDELAQWLKFIENRGNKEVNKVKEELAHLSGDPDFQRLVESREGMLRDIYCFKAELTELSKEEIEKL